MARQLEHFDNLVQMFLARARGKGDAPFLWAKREGEWRPISWAEARRQVIALATSLKRIGLEPGDRVMLNPGVSCGHCPDCLEGEESLCATFAILGEHRPGTAAELVVVPRTTHHVTVMRPQVFNALLNLAITTLEQT